MSNFKFASLGGVQENGKNMFMIEFEDKIFILDAGIKTPSNIANGVDYIIPDVTYLLENQDKIVGIFLTHGHMEHMGAIPNILLEIPNLKIYGSKFTILMVKELLIENSINPENVFLNEVNGGDVVDFDDVSISFFNVHHNIPECLGFAIHTVDGNIIYTGNFNFNLDDNFDFRSSFNEIVKNGLNKTILLLTDSLGATDYKNRLGFFELEQRLNTIFEDAKGRIIISIFSQELTRVQRVINIAKRYGKKIAILGRKTQAIIKVAIEGGYLKIDENDLVNLKYIDDQNNNVSENLVIIVTGTRHEPYFSLQRMARGKDRIVKIERDDNIIVLTNPYPGTEKLVAKTLDYLAKTCDYVHMIPNDLILEGNANVEDLKLIINLLNPKYIVPVIGEYRHQYALKLVTETIGFNQENILIPDIGDRMNFIDGEFVGYTDSIQVGEILIDGKRTSSVEDQVLKDRELLSRDGILMVVINVSSRTHETLAGPTVITKGFSCGKTIEELTSDISQIYDKVKILYLNDRYVPWNDFKNELKQEISNYIYKINKRNTIINVLIIAC